MGGEKVDELREETGAGGSIWWGEQCRPCQDVGTDPEWDASQWRAMSGNILSVSLPLCYRVWARAEACDRWESSETLWWQEVGRAWTLGIWWR